MINESWHLIRPSLLPRNGYFIKFTDIHIGTCKYVPANIGNSEGEDQRAARGPPYSRIKCLPPAEDALLIAPTILRRDLILRHARRRHALSGGGGWRGVGGTEGTRTSSRFVKCFMKCQRRRGRTNTSDEEEGRRGNESRETGRAPGLLPRRSSISELQRGNKSPSGLPFATTSKRALRNTDESRVVDRNGRWRYWRLMRQASTWIGRSV